LAIYLPSETLITRRLIQIYIVFVTEWRWNVNGDKDETEIEVNIGGEVCRHDWDMAVCLPNSDKTTEGTCVSCTNLTPVIQNGTLQDAARIGYLKSTCDPSSHGPNPVPNKQRNVTTEVRYLRWFLESSFVFEGKKPGEDCTASPGLSEARSYLHVLMKKHFRTRKDDGGLVWV
jgi:hypothetical protein